MSDTIKLQYGIRHAYSRDVEAEVQARLDGITTEEISDNAALAIAAGWQAPACFGRTFAQLASTGTVEVSALLDAIASEYDEAKRQGPLVAAELDMLATWALNHPSRTGSDTGSAAVWLLVAPLVVMVVMFAAQLAGRVAGVA